MRFRNSDFSPSTVPVKKLSVSIDVFVMLPSLWTKSTLKSLENKSRSTSKYKEKFLEQKYYKSINCSNHTEFNSKNGFEVWLVYSV